MARSASCRLRIDRKALPLLNRAAELAASGHGTGASTRNWDAVGAEVTLPADITAPEQTILTESQTSGGLLVAVAPEAADRILAQIRERHPKAAIIGRAFDGKGIEVAPDPRSPNDKGGALRRLFVTKYFRDQVNVRLRPGRRSDNSAG